VYEISDLFCEMYDALDRKAFRTHVEDWSEDLSTLSFSETVKQEALNGSLTSKSVYARIDMRVANGVTDINAARFAVLRALDSVFATINPLAPPTGVVLPSALRALAADAVIRGRYDSGTHELGGALIPRLLPPVHVLDLPDDPREAFSSVLRVPAQDWDQHELRVLPADALLHRHEVAAGLRVGCAPFIAASDEMDWVIDERNSRRFYRISPQGQTITEARISEVIKAFDDAGVRFGIVPELTLTPRLLEVWQRELAKPRVASRLQWVLVGSGALDPGARPDNTAVMLNGRTGAELVRQPKCFPFTLTAAELKRWKLEGLLGSDRLEEDLEPGSGLIFIDGGGIRIVILVCEDLARATDFAGAIRSFGATHVIVPVFARPLEDRRWARTQADQHCQATGSTVIVANSLITSSVMLGRLPEPADQPGIGMVITPAGGDATILCQADPAAVAAFTLNADGTVEYDPVS
jgi:hypothetical protein